MHDFGVANLRTDFPHVVPDHSDEHVPDVDQAPVVPREAALEQIDRPPAGIPFVQLQSMGKLMEVSHDGQLADDDDPTLGGDVMRRSA